MQEAHIFSVTNAEELGGRTVVAVAQEEELVIY